MFIDRRVRPAFRIDHVGPFLRSRPLIGARLQGLTGKSLSHVEDTEIRALVQMQERVGLTVVGDGELRRSFGHYDFLRAIQGLISNVLDDGGLGIATSSLPPVALVIKGPLHVPFDHPVLRECRFLAQCTTRVIRVSVPSPASMLWWMYKDQTDIPEAALAAVAELYRGLLNALRSAGCRYVVLDEVNFGAIINGQAQRWYDTTLRVLAASLIDRPTDVTVGVYLPFVQELSAVALANFLEPLVNDARPDVLVVTPPSEDFCWLGAVQSADVRILPVLLALERFDYQDVSALCQQLNLASRYCPLEKLGIAAVSSLGRGASNEILQEKALRLLVGVQEQLWGQD